MFYTFNQNNSGGSFDFDEKLGITQYVVIEASNHEAANLYMESIIDGDWCGGHGGYCPCCGERWSQVWSTDGDETPSIYGESIKLFGGSFFIKKGYCICVHYLDGTKEWY